MEDCAFLKAEYLHCMPHLHLIVSHTRYRSSIVQAVVHASLLVVHRPVFDGIEEPSEDRFRVFYIQYMCGLPLHHVGRRQFGAHEHE